MEYNLQKTLNSDYFDYDSNVTDFEIEQYDEITPGIGQIIQIDNIIVPIYHTSDLTTIIKDDSSEQLGAGVDTSNEIDNESLDTESPTLKSMLSESEKTLDDKESESEQNTKKRKIIDEGIHSSFLHPKMFKTKTLVLNSKPEDKNDTNKKKSDQKDGKKSLKHKFNIY